MNSMSFVELKQSCRTDTDTIYSSVSDPLPKSCVAFLGTDLDQIGSSSDSKRRILLCTLLRSRSAYAHSDADAYCPNRDVKKCQTLTWCRFSACGK